MRNQTWQKNEVEYNCCLTITTFGLTNVSETYERTQLRDLWQHVRWKSYGLCWRPIGSRTWAFQKPIIVRHQLYSTLFFLPSLVSHFFRYVHFLRNTIKLVVKFWETFLLKHWPIRNFDTEYPKLAKTALCEPDVSGTVIKITITKCI